MTELMPESFRELLDFYSEHHPDARFGDLDLPALQQAMQELQVMAHGVEAAEAKAAQVREEFGAAEAEVLGKAVRAVSFLKIHVEGDNAQVDRLEAIGTALHAQRRKSRPGLEVPAQAATETRQRRSRKSKNTETSAVQSNQPETAAAEQEALALNEEFTDTMQSEPCSASDGPLPGSVAAE